MVQKKGNQWEFHYHINKLGYRGRLVEIKENYDKKNIVVLGDSNTFGHCVEEGKQYTEIMNNLMPGYNVINLAVGGWALTQEIRRFYELGILYKPSIVILQFCSNDPGEDFLYPVTKIENGRFRFFDITNPVNPLRKYLSQSILNKSQIFNLLNVAITPLLQLRKYREETSGFRRETNELKNKDKARIDIAERYYNELLEKFSDDLDTKGIKLIMIGMDSELSKYKYIREKITDLADRHLIAYVEISDWFDYYDPEYRAADGAHWNDRAHKLIGEKLSQYILNLKP